jgi:transposase
MARRHELTDDQWALIADLFPTQGRGGRWADHRAMVNGVMWRLRTGVPWRDLPERYGPWQTVYHRFNALRRSGLLDRILERLQARLNAVGLIDAELFCVDGTVIRAARAAAGAVAAPKKK